MKNFDVAYFTISCDPLETNTRFAESLDLDYPILSDPTCEVAKAYGVVAGERKVPMRVTFYIGKDGKVLHVDRAVKAAEHGSDIAERLSKLGVEKSS